MKQSLSEEIIRNYRLGKTAWQEQRREEADLLEFQVPDLQWSAQAKAERKGADGAAPRPTLSISKLDAPVQRVLNEEKGSELGLQVHPISERANKDAAEVRQDLVRKIQRDSNADQIRSFAYERAVKVGWGVYRIGTEWDDTSDNPFDQRICYERVLFQENVVMDPTAQKPDFSDAQWAFHVAWLGLEDFKRQYPDTHIAKNGQALTLSTIQEQIPDWVGKVEGADAVMVAEYWRKTYKRRMVYMLEDGSIVEERPDKSIPVLKQREIEICELMYYKACPGGEGLEILEEQPWNGQYIPLIVVVGRELIPIKGKRIFAGMYGPAKDAQRLYNMAASELADSVASQNKSPYVVAEGQLEGYETEWRESAVRKRPYLTYKPTTFEGALVPPPQLSSVDRGKADIFMALLQQADDFLQSTTLTPDVSLGRMRRQDPSGKAIQALQSQGAQATTNYLDNLANAIKYEGKVVLDMMSRLYARPGRVVLGLNGDDKERKLLLNAPFIEENGDPVPVDPMRMEAKIDAAKEYALAEGDYGVTIDVGRSVDSRLKAGQEQIGALLEAMPDLMMVIGDLFMMYQDFPGAQKIADRLQEVIKSKHPEFFREEGQEPNAEQLKAMLQGKEAELKQIQQQLQQAVQAIQTDQAKQEAAIAKAKMDAQSKRESDDVKLMIEKMSNQTELAIQEMKQEFELRLKALDLQIQARNDAKTDRDKEEGEDE